MAWLARTLVAVPLALAACNGGGDGSATSLPGSSSGADASASSGDATSGDDDDSTPTTAGSSDDEIAEGTGPDPDDTGGDTGTTAGNPTSTDGDGSSTGGAAEPPPTDSDALQAWLAKGSYLDWPSESGPHDSAGPHFGTVRTFVNPTLEASLTAGGDPHPIDAASVKELYGGGAEVRGWSVLVKVAAGAGGDTWYFLEVYDDTVYGDGVGDGSCTGCHGTGSVDYFKSPFPLQ